MESDRKTEHQKEARRPWGAGQEPIFPGQQVLSRAQKETEAPSTASVVLAQGSTHREVFEGLVQDHLRPSGRGPQGAGDRYHDPQKQRIGPINGQYHFEATSMCPARCPALSYPQTL